MSREDRQKAKSLGESSRKLRYLDRKEGIHNKIAAGSYVLGGAGGVIAFSSAKKAFELSTIDTVDLNADAIKVPTSQGLQEKRETFEEQGMCTDFGLVNTCNTQDMAVTSGAGLLGFVFFGVVAVKQAKAAARTAQAKLSL